MSTIPNLPPNRVLQHLRDATSALHQRIDASLPLSRPEVDAVAYHAHMRILQAWMSRIAAQVEVSGGAVQEFAGAANKASLACMAQDTGDEGLHAYAFDYEPQSPAYCWGMQYVVEGSYLGAAMLHKKLASQLPGQPLHFFRHAASITPERWKVFVTTVDTHVQDTDIDSAKQGAVDAFQLFLKCASS